MKNIVRKIISFIENLIFYITHYKQLKALEKETKKNDEVYEAQAKRIMKTFHKDEEDFFGDNSEEW